jgi:outer membrane lipoprotein LolB
MSLRNACIAVLAIALAACASRPPREALPAIEGTPAAHQAARESALAAMPDWSLSGRLAISNGKEGGSGRIEWRQAGPRFDVTLSAPVTRQSWRVTGGEGEAVLEGLEGGTRTGPDAAQLVFEATRWRIPVDALVGWLRGTGSPAATLDYAADGRLRRLTDGGWTVEYEGWRDVAGVELPDRIQAQQGEARVRLVIDQWTAGSGDTEAR